MSSVLEARCITRSLRQGRLALAAKPTCGRRFQGTVSAQPPSNKLDEFSDLDADSSFATPGPSNESTEKFIDGRIQRGWQDRLPGNRYQYHPPKYDRGPLHPVQTVPSSDPVSREFVPGPFNIPRMKHTYDSTIASDILTLTYQHLPPGESKPESSKGELREWDNSSPYHLNRPRRGPRGPREQGILEKDIAFNNIPELLAVSIDCYNPGASQDKDVLQTTRAILQAITGQFPDVTVGKSNVLQWRVRKGDKIGAKTTLRGPAAYEFMDKLVHLVLPKIKDWPGIEASTGDRAGNLSLGLRPEWMSFFPEVEYNYSMYPARQIPGCNIYIQTTATSDRQGRLLMEALGLPFFGKITR